LPGIYRFGDQKPPDPGLEPQRISLYLPDRLLERAEAQALRSGFDTVQHYCEHLLTRAIENEHAREVMEEAEAKRGPLEGLDAVANDPAYLAEWTASASPRGRRNAQPSNNPPPDDPAPDTLILMDDTSSKTPEPSAEPSQSPAAKVVLRHAAMLGDDPSGFLPTLRRQETIDASSAQELIRALHDLEVELRAATRLDRRLAYALHRLAFEGQVLLTDGWSDLPIDEGTVDVLRIVQEAVDRVLSGEDIRYYAPGAGPERPL
jgi:hypothetical protein